MSLPSDIVRDEKEVVRHSRTSRWLFVLIAIVFALARLWRLTSSCLWFDEIFSVHAARHSWAGLLKFAAADIIHPPLFYALLKIWIAVGGESILWLRLLPFLISVATILPFALLCRELNLKPAETNLALLLMAVSGFQIKYAQEVRMYSLLLLLSILSIWLFLRSLKHSFTRKDLVALTALNLLLVYTHYYGWVLVAVEGLIVLISRRKHILKSVLSLAALLLAYLPWVYEVAVSREPGRGVAQNLGWIPRPGFSDVLQFYVVASKPFLFSQSTVDRIYDSLSLWAVFLLLAIPLSLFLWQAWRERRVRETEMWLAVLMVAPLIIAFALSWTLPYPVWGNRHLIICAAPLAIISSVAILRLKANWMRMAIAVLLGCWILFAAMIFVIRPAQQLTWCTWEGLIENAGSTSRERMELPSTAGQPATKPPIYAFEDLVAYHIWFAGTHSGQPPNNVTVIKGVPGLYEDPAFFLPRRFDDIKVGDASQIKGDDIWVAFRAPRWDENRPPLNLLKSLGYERTFFVSASAQGEQSFLVAFRKTNRSHPPLMSR
ncbi:MAG TPA: glycosyltransferase family 39 protein [Pyrinomonadaceae bacterium]